MRPDEVRGANTSQPRARCIRVRPDELSPPVRLSLEVPMRHLLPALLVLVACGKEPTAPSATSPTPTQPAEPAPAGAATPAPTPTPEPTPASAPTSPPAPAPTPTFSSAWTYEPEDRQRYAKTLVPRADGSLIVLGGSNRPAEVHLRITALDGAGKVLWDKTHGTNVEVSALQNGGGAALPDGGFVVVGQRTTSDLKREPWLGVFDPDGNPRWELALTAAETYALGRWVWPLNKERVLISTERGDPARPSHDLHLLSLTDKTFSTSAAPGQLAVPERRGDTVTALSWTYPDTGPKSETLTLDTASGALTPAPAPAKTGHEAAAGDSVLVTTIPLADKRLLVVRGHGEPSTVTLVLSDDSGDRLWRHFITDEGFDQVTVITPMPDGGFAFVAERRTIDPRGLREPDGYRVLRWR